MCLSNLSFVVLSLQLKVENPWLFFAHAQSILNVNAYSRPVQCNNRKHTKLSLVVIVLLTFQYGKTYHCPEEQGGWGVTDWCVVEGCCTRVKLMSFDHSTSLDIISTDRRCFGATNNWAHDDHDPCTRPVSLFFLCSELK